MNFKIKLKYLSALSSQYRILHLPPLVKKNVLSFTKHLANSVIFSSPVQSTGRAIVVTLASALALTLALPFPSRHF